MYFHSCNITWADSLRLLADFSDLFATLTQTVFAVERENVINSYRPQKTHRTQCQCTPPEQHHPQRRLCLAASSAKYPRCRSCQGRLGTEPELLVRPFAFLLGDQDLGSPFPGLAAHICTHMGALQEDISRENTVCHPLRPLCDPAVCQELSRWRIMSFQLLSGSSYSFP